jgi:hypothetical protein
MTAQRNAKNQAIRGAETQARSSVSQFVVLSAKGTPYPQLALSLSPLYHTTYTHLSQWPQSSDAPHSAQLALSAPRASTPAPRTLPLPPAAKPTRTPSSRAPARTPSSTYVDDASAFSQTHRKILRMDYRLQCCPITTLALLVFRKQPAQMTSKEYHIY